VGKKGPSPKGEKREKPSSTPELFRCEERGCSVHLRKKRTGSAISQPVGTSYREKNSTTVKTGNGRGHQPIQGKMEKGRRGEVTSMIVESSAKKNNTALVESRSGATRLSRLLGWGGEKKKRNVSATVQ